MWCRSFGDVVVLLQRYCLVERLLSRGEGSMVHGREEHSSTFRYCHPTDRVMIISPAFIADRQAILVPSRKLFCIRIRHLLHHSTVEPAQGSKAGTLVAGYMGDMDRFTSAQQRGNSKHNQQCHYCLDPCNHLPRGVIENSS